MSRWETALQAGGRVPSSLRLRCRRAWGPFPGLSGQGRLLRDIGQDESRRNADLDSPYVEARNPPDGLGGKGHVVVRADGRWQPVLDEKVLKDDFHGVWRC